MTVSRGVVTKYDNFDRAFTPTTTPAGDFGWTLADTSSAGAPTMACVTDDGGALNCTLAADSEVENMCLYQNNILPYDLAKLHWVSFVMKAPVAFVSGDTFFFGLGNARNDAVASVSVKTVFKLVAATSLTAVVIDTKDGTTAQTDVATGQTLTSTYKKFLIDFTNGLADVRFFIDGARVAASTTFNMSGITSGQNVQIMAQLYKASGTNVPQFQLSQVGIQYSYADGA